MNIYDVSVPGHTGRRPRRFEYLDGDRRRTWTSRAGRRPITLSTRRPLEFAITTRSRARRFARSSSRPGPTRVVTFPEKSPGPVVATSSSAEQERSRRCPRVKWNSAVVGRPASRPGAITIKRVVSRPAGFRGCRILGVRGRHVGTGELATISRRITRASTSRSTPLRAQLRNRASLSRRRPAPPE